MVLVDFAHKSVFNSFVSLCRLKLRWKERHGIVKFLSKNKNMYQEYMNPLGIHKAYSDISFCVPCF